MPIVETHATPIVQNHENHCVIEHAKHRPLCEFMPIRSFGAHLEILARPTRLPQIPHGHNGMRPYSTSF
jgi:hypothetical protein